MWLGISPEKATKMWKWVGNWIKRFVLRLSIFDRPMAMVNCADEAYPIPNRLNRKEKHRYLVSIWPGTSKRIGTGCAPWIICVVWAITQRCRRFLCFASLSISTDIHFTSPTYSIRKASRFFQRNTHLKMSLMQVTWAWHNTSFRRHSSDSLLNPLQICTSLKHGIGRLTSVSSFETAVVT